MRHRVFGNQLHRPANAAKSLYRSLLTSVFSCGKIKTTKAKAKAIQPDIDKLINLAKNGSVNAKRQIIKVFGKDLKIPTSFGDRNSGYSRITRLGERFSDTAEMVLLELLEHKNPEPKPEPKENLPKELKLPKKPKKATK